MNGELLPPPVLTKSDFVRRYQSGEFGNAAPTWGTLEEYLASGYRGLIHIRNRVANADTWYNVRREDARATWNLAISRGYAPEQLYVSAMAPTERTLIQGEVQRGVGGLDLTYTTVAQPMRDALREKTQYLHGAQATVLLQFFMNEYSWDWLCTLLDCYPDHVVEFSVYGVEWGTVSGHNTVFWEIRCGY